MVAVGNLKKKYYFPQIETYHFRAANNFIYGTPPPTQIPTAARPSKLQRCIASLTAGSICGSTAVFVRQ